MLSLVFFSLSLRISGTLRCGIEWSPLITDSVPGLVEPGAAGAVRRPSRVPGAGAPLITDSIPVLVDPGARAAAAVRAPLVTDTVPRLVESGAATAKG